MDWVEVTGKTVDAAVDYAMGELGVSAREDVDIEVLEEPKPGFLGMGGTPARVMVKKAAPKRRRSRGRGRNRSGRSDDRGSDTAAKNQTNDKKKPAGDTTKAGSDKRNSTKQRQEKKVSEPQREKEKAPRDDRPEQAPIEEQAEVAAGFVSGLLDAFGLEGAVGTRIDDDILYIDVTGAQTEALIGPKGSVMQSVLELTRTVVQRKTYGAPRMRIDIAGYVERRREALRIYAGKLSAQVIEDKNEIMLEPMNAADRKVLHDAIAETDGVRSYSEGEEPRRAVVIAYDGEE